MFEHGTRPMKSFISHADSSLFSLHNLPYGVFRRRKEGTSTLSHVGTAIGDFVLDLTALEQAGLLAHGAGQPLFENGTLNAFASQGPGIWSFVRKRIQSLLGQDNTELQSDCSLLAKVLLPAEEVEMMLPFKIEGFSDFYACERHASNVGALFRSKEAPLLPNWKFLPVAYNGRASTVFVSGTSIIRPMGQTKRPDEARPHFAVSRKLDFELELGIFVGVGNPSGRPISLGQAKDHIFGVALLNDWSARDVQAFEYQPLGPFLSKSFATSISPWVVPMAALAPFMAPLPPQVPDVVSYLRQETRMLPDITIKTTLRPHGAGLATTVCVASSKELYWTMEQMLAHHTINRCIMQPGDLLGSGTISGPLRANWGSLLEITSNGAVPLVLQDSNERQFLEDGDTVIMTGTCENDDYQIGFGAVEGRVVSNIDDRR